MFLLSQGAEDRLASCDKFHSFSKYLLPAEYGRSWTCLTALHMSIIKKQPELVQALSNEKNLKVRASWGLTALHLAARSGDEKMVTLLLSNGAKGQLNLKTNNGMTPKDIAATRKYEHLLHLFD